VTGICQKLLGIRESRKLERKFGYYSAKSKQVGTLQLCNNQVFFNEQPSLVAAPPAASIFCFRLAYLIYILPTPAEASSFANG
jgi:hypothetical protein